MGVLDDYKYSTGNTGGNGTATWDVKLGAAVGGAASSIGKSITSLLDPSKIRLGLATLAKGANRSSSTGTPDVVFSNSSGTQYSSGALADDWRLRLSVAPKSSMLYNLNTSKLLSPLRDTDGVIFPITSNIQVTHTAKYSPQSLTHSNYGMHFYEGSEVGQIMISGDFPIQNIEEGQYLLAAIYFFRAATKMYWGTDDYAGSPPPMLFLNGYGSHYFPNVSCVVTQFMHSMPDGVDYIDIPSPDDDGTKTRLPTLSQLQVTVQPILSRTKAHEFDLEKFAGGLLITGERGGYL